MGPIMYVESFISIYINGNIRNEEIYTTLNIHKIRYSHYIRRPTG